MKNLEYAGTALEPKLPQGKNVLDWPIRRDNTMTGRELCAWLAGHWDGDGWIGLNLWNANDRNAPFKHRPAIQITMTNPEIYNRVCDILQGLGIRFYERHVKAKNRKWKCHIQICNRIHVLNFLNAVYPFATRLKPLADVILEYFRFFEENRSNGGKKDSEEKRNAVLDFYDQLRVIRGSAKGKFVHSKPMEPPETTNRRLSELRTKDDGIVRLLAKAQR